MSFNIGKKHELTEVRKQPKTMYLWWRYSLQSLARDMNEIRHEMVMMTLDARQQKRHRCIERTFGL